MIGNASFSHCSASYGGAMYLKISGNPSRIEINDVRFEGNKNNASVERNTLYVVWKGIEKMT